MVMHRVKLKLVRKLSWMLVATAALSFLLSATGTFPEDLVESLYARRIYPHISTLMAVLSAARFSWIDVVMPLTFFGVIYLAYRRKVLHLIALLSVGYLWFFWGWGLNYHRASLTSKLDFSAQEVNSESVAALVEETAMTLNDLHPETNQAPYDDFTLRVHADRRMSQVLAELDGSSWIGGSTVKSSWILNPFFRVAGVDGMFNPFGHEALVTTGLLRFERPMVMLHEIAHVRGYPDEGDANFIALMAAVNSSQAALQYSGWLALWLYLRSPELDRLLQPGPRQDVAAVYDRVARNRIDWVSRMQTRSLDVFLKAHDVSEGVASYANIVTLAVGTRPSWNRFAE
jgi:hypothetical protein